MAHVSKTELVNELQRTLNTNAARRNEANAAFINLVDTEVTTNKPPIHFETTTTSGSRVLNLEVTQPANTIITGIDVICTAAASIQASGTVGIRVGTADGGEQLITTDDNAFNAASTGVVKGQICSTHGHIATMGSGSQLTLTPMTAVGVLAGMTTTERTIHVQVSASKEFGTNTGAFKPVITFERL